MIEEMSSATMKPAVHPFQTDDPNLHAIHEKVVSGGALSSADVTALYASKDILAIGWLANFVRERQHGSKTLATVDTVSRLERDKIVSVTGERTPEFLVPGGDLKQVCGVVAALRKMPGSPRARAWTVEQLAASGKPEEVSRQLHEAGADGLLGAGVEIFAPAVRQAIWRHESTAQQRSEARAAAAQAGLAVPLYVVQRPGSPQQQAAELLSFREVVGQDFSAISFDADASTSLNLAATTGMQEMKQIAIARLALDVPHIRAYWQMLGGKLVQIALRFGASHLDGSSLDGGESAESRGRELAREITVAGREPQATVSSQRIVVAI